MKKQSNVKFAFSKARYLEIIKFFKSAVKDPENKPYKCETYGTKYPGSISFADFIMYAFLRGKPTTTATHSVTSENYTETMRRIGNKGFSSSLRNNFGMTDSEIELFHEAFNTDKDYSVQETDAISFPLSKEAVIKGVKAFRLFVKDPENKPFKCESYGTKYKGNVTLEHFMLYAVMRGKSPTICTHNIESESYQEALSRLLRVKTQIERKRAHTSFSTSLLVALGLKNDELLKLIDKIVQ